MLEVKNLHVSAGDSVILKGINLQINPGEVHAIMGPNGSGKSTLSNILSGRDGYNITDGEVLYKGKNLFDLEPEERACEGIFLAFQYPVEIPGVSNIFLLKSAVNSIRKHHGLPEYTANEFLTSVKKNMAELKMDEAFLYRSVNEGFSGGEKKRNEVLQMAMLQPTLAILDETDSGLDIDALKIVADGINAQRSPDRSFIVVTHYQRLLDYIVPDYVHVLAYGKIVKSGDKSLAHELEKQGYGWIEKQAAQ